MPVILSLETSTDVCSVALHDSKTLLSQAEIHQPQSHASRLAPLIDQVVREANINFKDIKAVATTQGPGSYTGLRIGTSTAKGLCYALDVPLLSVGTLELLAFQANVSNTSKDLLCPMIDARRMEVYCLVADAQLKILEPVSAKILDENSFRELLGSNRMLFFGNGSTKCREIIRHPNASFLDNVYPRASVLGLMAEKKFQTQDFEDLIKFKPFYLKEFVAKKAGAGI
ncbi:MAG: tRNA (adenosine(37)-N6)-threonylcarbamoyltransferase complex dimerization subunit type 1 TsaB [Cyclobacteriaceae bacterium]